MRRQQLWVMDSRLNTYHYDNLHYQLRWTGKPDFHPISNNRKWRNEYKIIIQYPLSIFNLSKVWLQNFSVSSWEQITTENAWLVSFGYNYLEFQADKEEEEASRAQLSPFSQRNVIWYIGLSLTDTCRICILGFRSMDHSAVIIFLYCL